jgi:hypothetical protein
MGGGTAVSASGASAGGGGGGGDPTEASAVGFEADPIGAAPQAATDLARGRRAAGGADAEPDPAPSGARPAAAAEAAEKLLWRFERPAPMQLWGVDIVEGIRLVNEATGVLREAK